MGMRHVGQRVRGVARVGKAQITRAAFGDYLERFWPAITQPRIGIAVGGQSGIVQANNGRRVVAQVQGVDLIATVILMTPAPNDQTVSIGIGNGPGIRGNADDGVPGLRTCVCKGVIVGGGGRTHTRDVRTRQTVPPDSWW